MAKFKVGDKVCLNGRFHEAWLGREGIVIETDRVRSLYPLKVALDPWPDSVSTDALLEEHEIELVKDVATFDCTAMQLLQQALDVLDVNGSVSQKHNENVADDVNVSMDPANAKKLAEALEKYSKSAKFITALDALVKDTSI